MLKLYKNLCKTPGLPWGLDNIVDDTLFHLIYLFFTTLKESWKLIKFKQQNISNKGWWLTTGNKLR